MPTLHVLSGPDLGRSFRVESGALIGRSAECQVALGATSVSRQHARLEFAADRWRLVDLGSRNGIASADGEARRVPELQLEDSSEFLVGDVRLRLRLRGENDPVVVETTFVPSARIAVPAAGRELEPEILLEPRREVAGPRVGVAGADVPPPPSSATRPRVAAQQGWLTSDIEQWPLPLKWLAGLLALATCCALGYGVFVLVTRLRD
ncbi:MAG: FHA domain-containing protein [Planctomycetes bacterium]|nr:FHA domain-containing protein [Planctomycetota bacterium]